MYLEFIDVNDRLLRFPSVPVARVKGLPFLASFWAFEMPGALPLENSLIS